MPWVSRTDPIVCLLLLLFTCCCFLFVLKLLLSYQNSSGLVHNITVHTKKANSQVSKISPVSDCPHVLELPFSHTLAGICYQLPNFKLRQLIDNIVTAAFQLLCKLNESLVIVIGCNLCYTAGQRFLSEYGYNQISN